MQQLSYKGLPKWHKDGITLYDSKKTGRTDEAKEWRNEMVPLEWILFCVPQCILLSAFSTGLGV